MNSTGNSTGMGSNAGGGNEGGGQERGVGNREGDPRKEGQQDLRTLGQDGDQNVQKDDPSRAPESGTP